MGKRILFITATRIGDAVLSAGALDHLVRCEPDAEITLACGPPAAPLFKAAPNVARLLVVRKRSCEAHWLILWCRCIHRRWHMVVDLRGSAISWLLFTRRRIVNRGHMAGLHRVEEIAAVMGLDAPPPPRLWIPIAAEETARTILPAHRPVLCIAPTANQPFKEWPHDRFAALIRRLTTEDGPLPGAAVVLVGAPEERERVEPLVQSIADDQVLDLYGQPLTIVAAAIARANLFVGNDSGLMHLAAAAGVPTLGLFGPTNALRYAPWGPAAAHVRAHSQGREAPINQLAPEDVAKAAKALVARCQTAK